MIENILLTSPIIVNHVVQSIESEPMLFDELYAVLFHSNPKIIWRAAWVLEKVQRKMPYLLTDKKIEEILSLALKTNQNGLRRSLLLIIKNSRKYELFSVDFINQCFEWMISPQQPYAIQVYSMYILCDYCAIYPEFTNELIVCLENAPQADYSKSFVAARRKVVKILGKKPYLCKKLRHEHPNI